MGEPASWPRRLWRTLYWWREDRRVRARYPGINHVVYFGGDGIGDELLLSTPLRELRRRGATGLCAMTSRPELFHGTPDADRICPVAHADLPYLARVGARTSSTVYIHERRPPDIDVAPPRHLLAEMCRLCGITGDVALRPWLHLTAAEKAAAAPFAGCIAIQSSRQSASLALGNKEWLPGRFQAVVDALAPRHRIVQLGLPTDPLLRGAEDLRGKKSLRESGAILAGAAAFVGLVGFLMHLARAVDCPAVIVYGGREHPDQSGYVCNENLFTPLPCSPCWRWNSCDFEHRCMSAIQPDHVTAALARLLTRPRAPLAVAHAHL
ncbi:MAG: glycosyltransferase family 9 protein [Verrucomicrobia bacterium]|nr:glycosyltransferase family 9 protein [Verrucomicrobiota bacterium]